MIISKELENVYKYKLPFGYYSINVFAPFCVDLYYHLYKYYVEQVYRDFTGFEYPCKDTLND